MPTLPEQSFIPLAPAAPGAPKERPDFRVTVASQPANAQPFHALGQNPPASAAAANREPRITLRRENNRITAIVVECSCGQTHELACVYDEPAAAAPAPPPAAVAPPTPQPTAVPAPTVPVPTAVAVPASIKSKVKSGARKSKR